MSILTRDTITIWGFFGNEGSFNDSDDFKKSIIYNELFTFLKIYLYVLKVTKSFLSIFEVPDFFIHFKR